eukprot:CAMPEP_0194342554 /NCGR_PEP_ID=MMETSP0171-20130528/93333_1 /TAXON_ID=218684 /ORGANISM="Corethron pennatum, Strain L29A3" /LENGTH=226 /DNA_ID=CAMNT_0039108355 /DNA_START=42 /DNA_END=720 /DNA_ORIENTATION=-
MNEEGSYAAAMAHAMEGYEDGGKSNPSDDDTAVGTKKEKKNYGWSTIAVLRNGVVLASAKDDASTETPVPGDGAPGDQSPSSSSSQLCSPVVRVRFSTVKTRNSTRQIASVMSSEDVLGSEQENGEEGGEEEVGENREVNGEEEEEVRPKKKQMSLVIKCNWKAETSSAEVLNSPPPPLSPYLSSNESGSPKRKATEEQPPSKIFRNHAPATSSSTKSVPKKRNHN